MFYMNISLFLVCQGGEFLKKESYIEVDEDSISLLFDIVPYLCKKQINSEGVEILTSGFSEEIKTY